MVRFHSVLYAHSPPAPPPREFAHYSTLTRRPRDYLLSTSPLCPLFLPASAETSSMKDQRAVGKTKASIQPSLKDEQLLRGTVICLTGR